MVENTLEKCFITDLPVNSFKIEGHDYSYTIETRVGSQLLLFNKEVENWSKSAIFLPYKYIFAGALINGTLFDVPTSSLIITPEKLFKRLPELIYPKTPKDKMDNLFKTLVNAQTFDGVDMSVFFDFTVDPLLYYGHYFKSKKECNFYIKALHNKGYIEATFSSVIISRGEVTSLNITYDGLNYYNEITEKGKLSNKCFVAMSFADSTKPIRQSIKEALKATGFDPIIVDEVPIDPDKTINDAIIAKLKECKFCIADFTEQKDGVYFESGFALGQGKQVIYTCQVDWFNGIKGKSHFDTDHFPHIIYETPDELKSKLIDRINAWVK